MSVLLTPKCTRAILVGFVSVHRCLGLYCGTQKIDRGYVVGIWVVVKIRVSFGVP